MPAYNGSRYIADSITSVIDQTYQNWELIVVDDGSVDRTRDIISQFKEIDGRINYIYQQNGGQGKARNTGIKQARGELIAFLDQDDLWSVNKLELQVQAMRDNGVDVVFSDAYLFRDIDISGEEETFLTLRGKFEGREMLDLLFIQNRIPILSALVKKSSLECVSLIDESADIQNCDDYDLWIRLAENGASFFGMCEKLAKYREHQNQASKNIILSLKSELAVLRRHRPKVNIGKDEEKERYRKLYNDLLASLVKHNNFSEARKYSYHLLTEGGFKLISLFQTLTLFVYPSKFNLITYLFYRIKERASLLMGKTINYLRQPFSQ
jgi:glycosyltransferase involved in cell wall biosynthesis